MSSEKPETQRLKAFPIWMHGGTPLVCNLFQMHLELEVVATYNLQDSLRPSLDDSLAQDVGVGIG